VTTEDDSHAIKVLVLLDTEAIERFNFKFEDNELAELLIEAELGSIRLGITDVQKGELAAHLEEQLGRRPDHLEARGPGEEQVRARVDAPERAVEPDPIERRAGRRVRRKTERLASGEDDLDRLARGDGILGDLDRVDVLVAAEEGIVGVPRRDVEAGMAGALEMESAKGRPEQLKKRLKSAEANKIHGHGQGLEKALAEGNCTVVDGAWSR